MSVITNKDRINDNNDRINRLIELVKQKALTSNPKYVTTEEEMEAMLTDKNIGKVIKYLGGSDGAAIGTPFAEGDVVEKIYFNTDIEPDLSQLDFTGVDGFLTLLQIGHDFGALVAMDIGHLNGDGSTGYCLGYQDSNLGQVYLYASEDFIDTIGIGKGWNTTAITDGALTISTSETVDAVEQSEVWSSFISKEPFVANGKYEKNALYIVAEGEREVIENPTAVGDEVTQIYFDTTKTTEEIYADLQKLTYEDVGDGLFVVLAFMGAMETGKYVVIAKAEIIEQDNKVVYMIGNGGVEPNIFAYSPDMTPAEADITGVTEWGWQATSPVVSMDTYTITQVNSKEIWGS